MKNLRKPTREEFPKVEAMVKLNQEEEAYWDYVMERRKTFPDKSEFEQRLLFYLQEMKNTRGRFNDGRIAVKRRLRYSVAHTLECLAEFVEDIPPEEKFRRFRRAAKWYQLADETVGFLTDYGLRQGQCHLAMTHYGKQIGLEAELTDYLGMRGMALLSGVLGGNVEITNDEKFTGMLKAMATKKVESCSVDVYLVPSKGGVQ
ncbi:MAG: hypothetical protein V1645_03900 [archaeon]